MKRKRKARSRKWVRKVRYAERMERRISLSLLYLKALNIK